MKTAEQWAERLRLRTPYERDELRQALLAAYRQGCTDAAKVYYGRSAKILALRDAKKLEEM